MPKFHLTTIWLIPAPVKTVWSCLVDTETWPSWWKYVIAVEQTAEGDSSGINNIRRYYWRTCLPYSLMLNLRVTQIQANRFINVKVTGDLQGDGSCRLSSISAAGHTQVEFNWNVQTCKPWMNWCTLLTRPVFA
ncbi:MAG: SRPBCC family protein, partial [Methylobacter sp.]